jgi:predicted ATPase/class 3 adenylate cyclase
LPGAPDARIACRDLHRLSPTETLTFLFTDIEGSTTALRRLGDDAYARLLAAHHEVVRSALARHQGEEVDTQGDAFFAVFSSPRACLAGALDMQRAMASDPLLAGEKLRVRMGIHSGEAERTATGLVGLDVHRAARVAGVAHGGQVLVSESAAALVRNSLADGVSLLDLGNHRLKDLGQPERIYQAVADGLQRDFPPLKSLDNPALPNNLPAQLGSFVGRQSEVAQIREMLQSGRLVTLTGAGGCGKTRLAIQVAAELLDGAGDGVFLVELAAVLDETAVPEVVRETLQIAPQPGRSAEEVLLSALEPQRLLVVLDNCEHLIGACAKLADSLLRHCPNVHLLTTSREPLGISGESIYRVPSLSISGEDGLGDAALLFLDRARGQGVAIELGGAERELVVSICRRLDGMPLAIELAAARTRSMSLAAVHDRLDQRFRLLTGGSRSALERQQTLRATVDWSYSLLNEAEQATLRRLSGFAGGFDLEAAEAVCAGEDIDAFDVADHVGSLVDKSLVALDPTGAGDRYHLLETIRQYAAERLLEEGEAAVGSVAARHAAHYLSLAMTAEPFLAGPEQVRWMRRLSVDDENLRRAVEHVSSDRTATEQLFCFAKALGAYWLADVPFAELSELLLPRLEEPPAEVDQVLYGYALLVGAGLNRFSLGVAVPLVDRALTVAREAGDERLLVMALAGGAECAYLSRVSTDALLLAEEAVERARRLQDPVLLAASLGALMMIRAETDPEAVPAFLEEALAAAALAGNKRAELSLLNNAAVVALRTGEIGVAEKQLERAYELREELGALLHHVLVNLAWARWERKLHAEARALFEEALRTSRRNGDSVGLAYSTLGLGCLEAAAGRFARAAVLLGSAEGQFESIGEFLIAPEDRYRDEAVASAQLALGSEEYDRQAVVGRAMGVQESFEFALSFSPPEETSAVRAASGA